MTEHELVRALEERLLGRADYTTEELLAQSGMDFEEAERLWTELGFPPVADDVRHFTAADVDILHKLHQLEESGVVSRSVIIGMTRVLGQALARVANAQAQIVAEFMAGSGGDVSAPSGGPGTGALNDAAPSSPESAAARAEVRLEGVVHLVAEGDFERFISYAWRRHLAAALHRQILSATEVTETIGFADLVSYTRLTTQLSPAELPAVIDRFEGISNQRVTANGGRVLKMMGDAVMFSAPGPVAAARAGLGLSDAADDGTVPAVRIGIATGPTVGLEGDVYGDTVNRASRLAELARPGTVLVDDETAAALFDYEEFSVRPLRPRLLKGLGYVRGWVVRPVSLPPEAAT